MVSGVVTRSPAANVDSMPSRSSCALICGPPPCTTTGPQPGVAQEDDVLGERRAQRLVGHRVAAVLDHDGRAVEALQPGQRLDQRRGLRRAAALRAVRVAAVMRSTPSSRARSRRSGRWCGSSPSCVPACRSTVIVDVAGRRSTLDRSSPRAAAADPDAVDRDVEPRRARTTASVVPTADSTRPQLGSSPWMRALEQVAAGDRAADRRPRRPRWRRRRPRSRSPWWRPRRRPAAAGEVGADPVTAAVSSLGSR